ncbi:FAD-dependent oxidoreductase [Micromonospora sp. NPDC047707]|uniref:FAD-dependent oxidoreductase n=1 Tax=Micromonospora sp. NPDC047707 TaxID=3154498 RepID=UPI003456A284
MEVPMQLTTTEVLVVGAGPVGLATAVTLASKGVDVAVVDRIADGANTSRAAVIHAHTLEVLEAIGVAEPLAAQGIRTRRFTIRDRDRILVPVSFDNLPTRFPYALLVSQAVTEAVLLKRLVALGGRVLRPFEVVGLTQDEAGCVVTLADGEAVRARFVVGADGMRSTVRRLAGIGFGGESDRGETFTLADVEVESALPRDEVALFFSNAGLMVWAPLPDGTVRIVANVDNPPESPSIHYIQVLLNARGPARSHSTVRRVVWGSRFRVHHRVADTFRSGSVLLAGDAGHVHSPAGGQGMNLGLHDAVALGRALSEVLRGGPESILDEYAAARRPVAKDVLKFTARLTRLATVSPPVRPLRNALLRSAAALPAFRRRLAWRLSGLVYRRP